MSVVERINQINEEKARVARKEAAKHQEMMLKRDEELRLERKPREDFVRSQFEKINNATGIVDMLRDLDSNYWKKTGLGTAHGIIRKTSEKGVLLLDLVWRDNNTYRVKYKRPEDIASGYGFYKVSVSINPDSESITIRGKSERVIGKEDWSNDRKLVEDTLVSTFMDPWYSGNVPEGGWN